MSSTLKIAVIGANGHSGSALVNESLSRGHDVTAIVRGSNKSAAPKAIIKDVFDLNADDLAGFDVVFDGFGVWDEALMPNHPKHIAHLASILAGSPTRLLVVGGAGSLFVDEELKTTVMDTPDFPEDYKAVAYWTAEALKETRKHNDVLWTYFSPAGDFRADGPRTGKYILGGEHLTLNSKGESVVSYADFAVAMVDEAEAGKHVHERVGVVADY